MTVQFIFLWANNQWHTGRKTGHWQLFSDLPWELQMHHEQGEELVQCYGCGNIKIDQKVEWLSLASMKGQFCPVIPLTCSKMLLLAWPLLLHLVHWQSSPHKTAALSLHTLLSIESTMEISSYLRFSSRHSSLPDTSWSGSVCALSGQASLLCCSFTATTSCSYFWTLNVEFTYPQKWCHRWHLPLLEKGVRGHACFHLSFCRLTYNRTLTKTKRAPKKIFLTNENFTITWGTKWALDTTHL